MQEDKKRVWPKAPSGLADELLTLTEARLLTGWHASRLYRAVHDGRLVVVRRAGHQLYYLRSQLEALGQDKATFAGVAEAAQPAAAAA